MLNGRNTGVYLFTLKSNKLKEEFILLSERLIKLRLVDHVQKSRNIIKMFLRWVLHKVLCEILFSVL